MTIRVLFVDDEQSLLNSIQRRLGTQFMISTATSGREALELIESSEPFPVICSDMRMPWMDGTEFIKRARLMTPATTFVMLTGNQDQETAKEALNEAEVFRFLRKPIHTSEISDTIIAANEDHLDRQNHAKLAACDDLLAAKILDEISTLASVSSPDLDQLVKAHVSAIVVVDEKHWQDVSRAVDYILLCSKIRDIDLSEAMLNPESDDQVEFLKVIDQTVKILMQVPRLDFVAAVLFSFAKANGAIAPPNSDLRSATMRYYGEVVRVAFTWGVLANVDSEVERSSAIRNALSQIDADTIEAMISEDVRLQNSADEVDSSDDDGSADASALENPSETTADQNLASDLAYESDTDEELSEVAAQS